MSERALNLPFEANEVKEIATAEFRKRLDGLSPLMGAKEYLKFALDFEVKIKLWRNGDSVPRETLAWGNSGGEKPSEGPLTEEMSQVAGEIFESKDPNTERMSRDMPLTVEGAGGKRRKVNVKK